MLDSQTPQAQVPVTTEPVYISLEFTPNPNSLKYSVNRELLSTRKAVHFTQKETAQEQSPLAHRLFEVPGIVGVMIGKNFITVTKEESGDWDVVHQNTSSILENHLNQNGAVVLEEKLPQISAESASEAEKLIREILEHEIRPAVAMDGGDITFDRYEDGILYLEMKGSCAGCPSSTLTLKQGIEARLQEFLPELIEVVQV